MHLLEHTRQEREAVLYTYRKDSWTVQSLYGSEWNWLFSEPSEKYKAEALSLHLAPEDMDKATPILEAWWSLQGN